MLYARQFKKHNPIWNELVKTEQEIYHYAILKIRECLQWQNELKHQAAIPPQAFYNAVIIHSPRFVLTNKTMLPASTSATTSPTTRTGPAASNSPSSTSSTTSTRRAGPQLTLLTPSQALPTTPTSAQSARSTWAPTSSWPSTTRCRCG